MAIKGKTKVNAVLSIAVLIAVLGCAVMLSACNGTADRIMPVKI